jgi:hypothetical protein
VSFLGTLPSFVRGRDLFGRALPTLTFSCGFLLSAFSVFFVLSKVGEAVWTGSMRTAVVLLIMAVSALLLVELRMIRRRRRFSIGPSRQTDKILQHVLPPWTVGFIWGADAGSAVTTFRTTVGTWVVVALCGLGLGVWWIGAAYALGFLVPLGRSLWTPRDPGRDDAGARVRHRVAARSLRPLRLAVSTLTLVLVVSAAIAEFA